MTSQKLIYRLTVYAIVPAIFSMIVFGCVSYSIFKEKLIDERIEEAISIIGLSAEEIKNPLYFLELDDLNIVIRNIKKNPNVLSVYIMDRNGRVITDGTSENIFFNKILNDDFSLRSTKSEDVLSEIKDDVLQVSAPVIIAEKIGTIRIDFSLHELDIVLKNLITLLGIIGTVILFGAAAIDYSISSSISRPIIKLKDAALEIARGNFNTNIEIEQGDEIGELARAFNNMAHDLQKSSNEIISAKEYTDNIVLSMTDTLIVTSPDGTIKQINPAACTLLGYKEDELINQPINKVLEDGDKLLFDESEHDHLTKKGSIQNVETIYSSKDMKKIPVLFSASVMDDNYGNIQGIVCVAQDITERKLAEEQTKRSLQEKEVLLREIHHRVKNNMQIISSLMMHQMEYTSDKNVIDIFTDSLNRIISMSLVHEKLYQSRDMTEINLNEYINDLVVCLFQSFGVNTDNITLNMDLENISSDIDSAIPCGLIVNELVTNCLKHAFPDGMRGEIKIVCRLTNENMVELVVSDNGIGIPKDLDFRETKSLGLHLVTILAEKQLHGEVNLDRSKGTEFQIKFRGLK